jgi:hypothetical protein
VETIAGGSTLTAVGDRSQIYDSGDGVSWAFTDMTPAIVTQDPPFMLGLDIGLTTLANPEKVAGDDVTGWVLSDEGAVWTKNGGEWMLPPTVASFTPESGPAGTTLTIYGSGFKPRISRDSGAIGWVDVTDGGSGYAEAPLVAIESPLGGRQATATAVIDATGMVTAIEVTDGGSGYTPGAYSVAISAPPAGGVTATATAFSVASAAVEFAGGTLAVPSSVSDSVLTVEVPLDAVTGRFAVTTINGTGWSPGRLEVLGTTPETQTHLSNHSGGSGQDNQLHGLAVVDWVNAWAVGDRGTILSFDRLAPATTVSPANGWVKTPSLTLTANDAKSGVWATRWVVDPPGIEGNVRPPIGDWESWEWQYGSTVTFKGRQEGDAPGARHVIYYQAIDNVGNVELDPFWRGQAADDPEYEVPKHVWVTLDTEGPQTYAPWAVTVKRNSKPAFDFWVNDDLSDKAKVTIVVKNGAGSTVKTLSLGWLATWHEFSSPISDWKCTLAKGAYTFEVRAVDQAGNSQQVPAGGNTFTVR